MMFQKGANIKIMPSAGTKIIEIAEKFVGLHETVQNTKWDNPDTAGEDPAALELKRLMESTGWQEGWPYCASMVEAVWMEAYHQVGAPRYMLQDMASRFTPSVVRSYKNWEDEIVTTKPARGAVFFMQLGKTWRGHAGIVVKVVGNKICTIEGNTSPEPDNPDVDREGDGVYKRVRSLDFTEKPGLWLRGFLNPIEVA